MKEFSFAFEDIFSGLIPFITDKKKNPSLLECHNLVPIGENYILHSLVTDLNADGIAWGGVGGFITDIWEDHADDNWQDDDSDDFIND